MPTCVTREDGASWPAEEVRVELPDGLDVRVVVIQHGAVSFYDEQDRESILIQHGTYPGAGMAVDFALHVRTVIPTQDGPVA